MEWVQLMKKRLRKILRLVAWATASLCLIFILIHLPPLSSVAKGILTRTISKQIDGQITIEHLNYKLWRGSAEVENIAFQMPGIQVKVARVDISFALGKGISIKAEYPSVLIRSGPKTSTPSKHGASPSRFWTILKQFEKLSIENGQFDWASNSMRVKADGSVSLVRYTEEQLSSRQMWKLEANLEGRVGDKAEFPLSIRSIIKLKDDHLYLSETYLRAGQTTLSADGALCQTAPFEGDVNGKLYIEDSMARILVPDFPIKGMANGQFQFKISESGIESRLDFESPQLFVMDTGPWDIKGNARFDGSVASFDSLAIRGYGGLIDARGSLELKEMKLAARITASEFDPNPLLDKYAKIPYSLSSHLGAEIQLTLYKGQFEQNRAKGVIRFKPLRREGLPLSGEVDVELAKGELIFASEFLKMHDSQVAFSGKFQPENLSAQYVVNAAASDIPAFLDVFKVSLPRVQASGYIDAAGGIDTDFSDVSATAQVQSRELNVESVKIKVLADIQMNHQELNIKNAEIVSEPGKMTIQGAIPLADSSAQWDLSAELESFDLSAFSEKYGWDVSAEGNIRIQGPAGNPAWSTGLQLSLANAVHPALEGKAFLKAQEQDNVLTVEEFKVDLDEGSMVASGTYKRKSGEIKGQMSGFGFQVPKILSFIKGKGSSNDVNGIIAFDADFRGTMSAPDMRLNLNAKNLSFKESPLPDFSLSARTEGDTVELKAFAGDQFLTGSCQLSESFPLRLSVDLSALPLNEMLAGSPRLSQILVTSVKGQVEITAPLRDPKAAAFQAKIEAVKGTFDERNWTIQDFSVEGDLTSLLVRDFHLKAENAVFELDGRLPLSQKSQFDVSMKGTLNLKAINLFIPQMSSRGEAELNLQLTGTFKQPQFSGMANIQISHGHWKNLIWENLEVQITGDEDTLQLKKLSVMILSGSLTARGQIRWTNSGIENEAAFEFDNLDLKSLLQDKSRVQPPSMQVSGKGRLSAKELSLAAMNGSGQITLFNTSLGEPPIRLQNPVTWNLKNGNLTHTPIRLVGENTDCNVIFNLEGERRPLAWHVKVNGYLSPMLGSFFIDRSFLRLAGKTNVELDMKNQNGTLSGQATLDGGRIRLIDPPLSISQIKAQLSVQDNNIQITELKGQVGTGEINISGQVKWIEAGSLPEVDMHIAAEQVTLSPSVGVSVQFSGNTRFTGSGETYTLGGEIQISRILISKLVDSGSESLAYLDRQMRSLEEPSFLSRISLNIKADVREIQISTKMIQLSASGILSATGSPDMLELNGNLRMNQGGYFQLNRARVHITEGSVALEAFPDQQPEVNISGFSRVSGIFIELTIRGRIDNLQTQIVAPNRSDLTQGDLVMILMTGRTSSEAVSSAGTVAAEGLAASLGGLLQAQAGEKVYIDVAPDQSIFSYDSDPTTRFSIGHIVAPNLYVIYSTALGGTEKRAIVDYDTTRGFRLRYIYEEDGRQIVEATHRLSFRFSKKQGQSRSTAQTQRKISAITFEGESPFQPQELQKSVRLKPGKKYDYWNAFQGTTKIQNKLVKLGYKGALVNFEERSTGPGEVEVVYLIEKGKRIKIVWKGVVPKKRLRKKIEALWDGRMPEDALPGILARQTKYALQAQKYFTAQVEPHVTQTQEEMVVELNVATGPKGQGVTIKFVGNDSLSDKHLLPALPDPQKPQFFEAIDERATRARQAIDLRYATEGFIQAQVTNILTEYDTDSKEYLVTIAIDEGDRAIVGAIELPQEVTEAAGPEVPEFKLKEGNPFRIEDYVNDRTVLNSYYRDQGYITSKISGMLKPVDNTITVIFSAERGPKPRVGKIRKAKPGKTLLSTVEKALTLKRGDLIQATDLARSRKRLLETRVFQSIDIEPVPSEEGPQINDIVVDITEKPDIEMNYGLRYAFETNAGSAPSATDDYSAFQVGGSFDILNPFGFGHRYGVSGFLFGKEEFFRVYYETEFFFGLQLPTQVYLSDEDRHVREISNLKSHIQKITFQQYRKWGDIFESNRWGESLRLQWNYSFRHITLTPLDEERSPLETDRGSISLSLIGDTRDSFVNPSRGLFWSTSYEYARTWLGSDVNFNKLFGQVYSYVPLGDNLIWASGVRLGAVAGENPLLIIEDRFKAGGPNSIRGFPVNSLGPTNELGEPLGGQAVFILNQELRFPVYKSFHGGIFYDLGNVFALTGDMSFKGLRHCAGLGVRYMLPFGPIRVDWAYVLDPKPGESRSRFVFTIGHAF